MATVTVEIDELVIKMFGFDRIWTVKSQLSIPLAHVRGATVDPGMVREPKGKRGPGTRVPGVVAGTFSQDGERVFWDVHDASRAVVVELRDEQYQRLVLQVDDPRGTVELIEEAVRQYGRLDAPAADEPLRH